MDTTTPARLTRSSEDRLLGGVAGGVAAFLGIDPTIVRIGFVLLTIFGGSGVVLYAVLWLIVPPNDDDLRPVDANVRAGVGEIRDAVRTFAGDVRSGLRRDGDAGRPSEQAAAGTSTQPAADAGQEAPVTSHQRSPTEAGPEPGAPSAGP